MHSRVTRRCTAGTQHDGRVFTPDFLAGLRIATVVAPGPTFQPNLETVPRLYPTIIPARAYFTSAIAVEVRDRSLMFTSRLMVGWREREEILQ